MNSRIVHEVVHSHFGRWFYVYDGKDRIVTDFEGKRFVKWYGDFWRPVIVYDRKEASTDVPFADFIFILWAALEGSAEAQRLRAAELRPDEASPR